MTSFSRNQQNQQNCRKQACVVEGCSERIALTMWRAHLNQHASGVFPGKYPEHWELCSHSRVFIKVVDPLGSFLFALVLHRLVLSIADDKECSSLLSQYWYIDDGVLAGQSTEPSPSSNSRGHHHLVYTLT